MKKLECPHCREPGIPWGRKLTLGPAVSTRCKVCDKKVSVPWAAILAIVPFVLAIVAWEVLDSMALWGGLLLAGFAVSCFIHMYWVPLKRR